MGTSWLRRFRSRARRHPALRAYHAAVSPMIETLEPRVLLSAVTLDPSFGDGGVSHIPLLGTDWEFPHDLLQQPDGKIIALGDTGDALRLARYHVDGSLDQTFGDGGRLSLALGSARRDAVGVIDSDGGIIIAAGGIAMSNDTQFLLLRLNADGSFDEQFGAQGVVSFGINNEGLLVTAIGLDSADRIVVSATEDLGNRVSNLILTRFQPDGALDATFGGGDGWLRQDLGYIENFEDLQVQADGGILVAGSVEEQIAPGNSLTIVRYTADGTLDAAFGINGIIQTHASNFEDGYRIEIHDIEVDSAGRLLVAGERYSNLFMARYLTSGALDTTFNSVGWRDVEYGATSRSHNSLALDSQGRILATGGNGMVVRLLASGAVDNTFSFDGKVLSSGDPFGLIIDDFDRPIVLTEISRDFNLLRYTHSGTLDPTFDGDGVVVTEFLQRKAEAPYGAYVQDDGKIVVVGQASARWFEYGTVGVLVARYNPDGSLDDTFGGGDGWMQMVWGDADWTRGEHVIVDAQGRIVIAGSYDFNGGHTRALVARLLPDGTRDPSFGVDGVTITSVGTWTWVRDLAMDSAGNVLVAAHYRGSYEIGNAILRYDDSGTLDPTWGDAGQVVVNQSEGLNDLGGIVVDADDRVVFSSYIEGDVVVGRLTTTGALDPTFSTTGFVRADLGGNDSPRNVGIDSQGRIIVGALSASTSSYTQYGLARYLPDGQLDPSFGVGGIASTVINGYARPGMMRIDPQDRVVVGGEANFTGYPTAPDILLLRFDTAGQLDSSFSGNGGMIIVDTGGQSDRLAAIVFDSDGRMIVASPAASPDNGTDIVLWRYLEDTPADDRPVAIGQQHSTLESTLLAGTLAGLDVEGAPLTFTLADAPAHGSLLMTSDGQVTYTPVPGYYGEDRFTFVVNDGSLTSEAAQIVLNVTPVNTPPQAVEDHYAISHDRSLTVPLSGVLANDLDADADALRVVIETLPAHGTLTIAADGGFTYTPKAGFIGSDSFAYRAFDGLDAGGRGTVNIAVTNSTPTTADLQLETDENVSIGGTLLASDADGDAVVVNHSRPTWGTLAVAPDQTFIYTPRPGWSGVDTFTYWAGDGLSTSAPATVSIQVNRVNFEPVGNPDHYELREGSTLTIETRDAGVLANDTDPDGDHLQALYETSPSLSYMFSFDSDGRFSYMPVFAGIDSFTYRVTDGEFTSDPVTVTLNVVRFGAPSGVTASVSGTSVSLNWTDNGNGYTDGFRIQRAIKPGGKKTPVYSDIATTSGTTFVDNNLSAGTYLYRVIAFDGTYMSQPSSALEVKLGTTKGGGGGGKPKNRSSSTLASQDLLLTTSTTETASTTKTTKSKDNGDKTSAGTLDLLALLESETVLTTTTTKTR